MYLPLFLFFYCKAAREKRLAYDAALSPVLIALQTGDTTGLTDIQLDTYRDMKHNRASTQLVQQARRLAQRLLERQTVFLEAVDAVGYLPVVVKVGLSAHFTRGATAEVGSPLHLVYTDLALAMKILQPNEHVAVAQLVKGFPALNNPVLGQALLKMSRYLGGYNGTQKEQDDANQHI